MIVSPLFAPHNICQDNLLTPNTDIILSLVRTRAIGYLRSIRRLTVALSRARLGLYILGRRSVFESVFELKPAFDILFQRPDKLALVTGEMFGETQRPVPSTTVQGNSVTAVEVNVEGETVMEGVEHLGKYVYEMTLAKIEDLKSRGVGGGLPTREVKMVDVGDVVVADGEDEDRPENVLVPEAEVGEDDAEIET